MAANASAQLPRALKVDQVAELLQINRKTVLRLIQTGEIRAVRAGRAWRIPTSAVETYLEGTGSEAAKQR